MKKQKLYRFTALSLGSAAAVIAPLATVIACGDSTPNKLDTPTGTGIVTPTTTTSNNQSTTPNSVDKNNFLGLKDLTLSEYDIERNVMNTSEYGILPLTRIQHSFEAKSTWNAPIDLKFDTQDVLVSTITKTKDLQDSQSELVTAAAPFIDATITVNGAPQSLINPAAKFSITKQQIIDKPSEAYTNVAKQINDFLAQNSANKYSVLTEDSIEDTGTNGVYEVRLYQKPKNSAELDQAINLFKTKFDTDKYALESMEGFTISRTNIFENWHSNLSIYSNYNVAENSTNTADDHIRKYSDMIKNGQFEGAFKQMKGDSPVFIPTGQQAVFQSSENNSGSALLQWGAKTTLTSDDVDFLNRKVSETGNLTINKKTNQVALELTVLNIDITKTNFAASGNITPDALDAYKNSSVETIYIDLPIHTSWIDKGTKTSAELADQLDKNLQQKLNFAQLYSDYQKLLKAALKGIMDVNVFEAQSHISPSIKNILIDNLEILNDASKYTTLLKDQAFLSKFIEWAENHNSGFSAATLNAIIENFGGIPTELGLSALTALNSSHLFSFFTYMNIFYRELNTYLTTDGVSYVSQLTNDTPTALVTKANELRFTDETTKASTRLQGQSVDSKLKHPDDLKDNESILTLADLFDADNWVALNNEDVDYKDVTFKVTDADKGTGEVSLTLASKLTDLPDVSIKFTVTNLLTQAITDATTKTLTTNLSTAEAGVTLPATATFVTKPADRLEGKIFSSATELKVTDNFRTNLKGYLITDGLVMKLGDFTSLVQGDDWKNMFAALPVIAADEEFVVIAKNIAADNSSFDLTLGLRNKTNQVFVEGTKTIHLTK